ncbi:hypothetical protein SAMN02949497_4243 [Methylomagnum ishizawai]|uniref:Uncharacterized protein n=1 Tax=Methylomagnum ishizawai TaxID=1760988 RepID=A0A1Y6D2J4_9GAMM|nr:hypothetical protein [Methylomagnum ishizawai]SMF96831.1 hypothetical protein SAMN02949497_4243 [Methylomagnum ishizawai]
MTVSVFFELSDRYGDPPVSGGGYRVGAPGDTTADLAADLRRRYGPRLVRMVDDQTGREISTTGEQQR